MRDLLDAQLGQCLHTDLSPQVTCVILNLPSLQGTYQLLREVLTMSPLKHAVTPGLIHLCLCRYIREARYILYGRIPYIL